MAFILFISCIILLRMVELFYARHTEKWLLQHGAIEYGKAHYPFIVALHTLFFVSLILEYYLKGDTGYSLALIFCYIALIVLKVLIIASLGHYWNTKIYRIPNAPLVKSGAYKYIKHPNYMVVITEIAIIPLAFHLYYTAVIFSLLNGLMLYVRISAENKVLQE